MERNKRGRAEGEEGEGREKRGRGGRGREKRGRGGRGARLSCTAGTCCMASKAGGGFLLRHKLERVHVTLRKC